MTLVPPPKAPKLPKAPVRSGFTLSKESRKDGNINLRFEGIPVSEMDVIRSYVAECVSALSGDLADDEDLMRRWFGTCRAQAKIRLGVLGKYLTERCEVLTFVRKVHGTRCDNAKVEISDYGQVLPTVMTAGLTSQSFRVPRGEANVPRGLRIFLSPTYFSTTPKGGEVNEKLNTILHEITHKVLDTIDHEYGEDDCLELAKKSPRKAAENADNYGYLLAEYVLKWA
jgi:hypothetical protein